MTKVDCDVAIVGAGPVGLAIAGLLARNGHEIVVVERHPEPYGLPRAVRFDGQAMRLFQDLGIVDAIASEAVAADSYRWFGADGDEIVFIDESEPARSGWAASYSFWQPSLETALEQLAAESTNVTVRRGREVADIAQSDAGVLLQIRSSANGADLEPSADVATELSARYLVGADGANSLVRGLCGIELDDLGFNEQWLVADVRPNDMSVWEGYPIAAQRCDPRRPTAMVQAGARHRRWEFMLLPGERADDFTSPDPVWELLKPYLGPADGTLVRSAIYTFTGRIARTWTCGRIALAGDAAHTMPPFMAEGLCTGLRDATNLAWRLDLMLRGVSDQMLLDGYTTERYAHARALIELSIGMGQVSCMLDPEQAAARDAAFRSGEAPPPPPRPGLLNGTLQRPPHDPTVVGQLAVQGVVTTAAGATGRFDDAVGQGFALVLRDADPLTVLSQEDREYLQLLGAHVVTLKAGADAAIADVDGVLSTWIDAHQLAAVLIRPDGYVFGSAGAAGAISGLVEELRNHLSPKLADAST